MSKTEKVLIALMASVVIYLAILRYRREEAAMCPQTHVTGGITLPRVRSGKEYVIDFKDGTVPVIYQCLPAWTAKLK